jgi:predicted PurR-regulated permease PerM
VSLPPGPAIRPSPDGTTAGPPDGGRPPTHWRQHLAFWLIGVAVVGTVLAVWSVLSELVLLLALLAVSLFFTIVLTPFVDRVQRRLHIRRTLATLVVFVIGTVVVAGIVLLFVEPIASSSSDLGRDLPKLVREAEHGRGRIGHVLRDLGVQGWVHDNLPAIRRSLGRADGPLVQAGVAVVSGVVATITIMVLVFLMLVEGPIFSAAVLDLFPPARAERIRRVGTDAARAMSGYAMGNLAISGLAGLSAYISLRLLNVPFALVLAVWVAFADLIPLVGATLGALPPIFIALLRSPGTAIAVVAFFVLYQLFENHVVQPVVMSRTVRINPLGVLLVVIAGVEIAGLLGALLALPVAGAAKVVFEDIWPRQRPHVEEVLAIDADESPPEDAPVAP